MRHSYSGEARGRYGESWGAGLMPSVQPCADGHVVLMGGPYRDQIFTLFGQPTPSEDDRPSDAELRAQFREFAAERTRDELFHAAQALRLPFAPVVTPQEILDSPQHHDRDYFAEVSHPEAGRLRHTGAPIQLGESPAEGLASGADAGPGQSVCVYGAGRPEPRRDRRSAAERRRMNRPPRALGRSR